MSAPADIILGDGVFSVGASSTAATAIALTRGGGNFSVEREFRLIEADGDYGPVKDRIRLIKEVAKLNMKRLEIVPSSMEDFYPGTSASYTTGGTTSTFTNRGLTTNVTTDDYQYVQWVGYNKAGRSVLIYMDNAINLENMSWDLIDKEEIVEEITFQGAYLGTARNTATWKVVFTTTSS